MTRTAGLVVASLACFLLVAACTARNGGTDIPDAALPDTASDSNRVTCRTDAECADRLACTIDHCTSGACEHVPCTDCCGTGFSCDPMIGCAPTPQACTMDAECSDAVPCTLDVCRGHMVCEHRPMDGLCPAGQICIGSVGCVPEPPSSCTTDEDCESIGFCYGVWDCATELGCAFVSPRSCDDADDCTADRCDGAADACAHDIRDEDADHHGDATCTGGDDCDDAVATTHPGATEACNGHDDDCDGTTDEGCCASGPCTTGCGSTGMTSCLPDGTVGPCMPPMEVCDGRDQDCDAAVDEDFDCAQGATGVCMTSCMSMGTSTCDATCHAGACMAPAESCNAMDDDCDGMPDEDFTCVRGTSSSCPTGCGSMGSRVCLPGTCTYDLCVPPMETCNGMDDDCDSAVDDGFTCARGSSGACSTMGFVSGTAPCRMDCTGYDTSTCSNCGNGRRDSGELCEGLDVGTATCASIGLGYTGGVLRCTAGCMYDTSMCARCGNGTVESGEQCDGSVGTATCASVMRGYTGTLRCGAGCAYDTSMCVWNPTGTWVVTPGVNDYCAFGAVSISFGNLNFNDTGSALSVSGGGINCTMTGASARATRTFDVTCTLLGGCNETYRLMGSFTDDNTWTGTFTATFSGSGCFGCTTMSFPGITGTR